MNKAGESIQKDIVVSNLRGKLPAGHIPHIRGCRGKTNCSIFPCREESCMTENREALSKAGQEKIRESWELQKNKKGGDEK